ncbi:peptidoglycan-binding protein, partial [Listeria monocytogenes]|nr:peptidoglycan-binding protein [Listeria monocytogenes]EIM2035353.1 peptidoglycan-binding protein [Listeria monocytogenes]EIM3306169.1 peptidoglycan-binding protein [Listeria monocytogenes]HAA2889169.1 peptidoglycan-binding protein [Listeria monocytogenes]
MKKQRVDYKRRLDQKRAQKAKLIAALITTTTMMVAPVTVNYDSFNHQFALSGIQADAATVDLLGNSNLNTQYSNGKLVITLSGNQLVSASAISTYYPYFELPSELSSILSNPNIRANTKIDYKIAYLGIGGIGLFNQGTVNGSNSSNFFIDTNRNAIGAKVNHLLGVGVGSVSTFTLTIDLLALGVTALPSANDGKLDFAARTGDGLLDVDLLNSNAARGFITTDVGDADADADA